MREFLRDANDFSILEPRHRWTMRVKRDPARPDVYRFKAVYIQASSPGTFDGSSAAEVANCVNSGAQDPGDCIVEYNDGLPSSGAIEVVLLDASLSTSGRGRKATKSLNMNFNYFVGGGAPRVYPDTGYDLWTTFMVEWYQNGSSTGRTAESTGNQGLRFSGDGNCVFVRPLQSYVTRKIKDVDFTASFDPSAHLGWTFDVGSNSVTERESAC